MVSAWWLAAALAVTGAPADSLAPPAEDPFPTLVREDAELDAAADGEFVAEEERATTAPTGAPPLNAAPWSRGRVAWVGGARALAAAAGWRRARAEILLAREDGEPRAIDDAYASLALAPAARTLVRAGWFEPAVGAGLVLGPRRVTPEAVGSAISPGRAATATGPWCAAPLSAVPARAATGMRGVALEHARGPWRVGALAAHTPREARASGAALRPLLGVRHRNAVEEARRGALDERTYALAASFAPARSPGEAAVRAWAIALIARTDPRRAPYEGSTAAAESAAGIVRGGESFELGAAWARGGEALLVAAAFDARGRARARLTASTLAAGARRTRAGLVLETEARGFVPPRALPERRPRAHAGVLLERAGRRAWSVEAHLVDRGPFAESRAWLVARLEAAPGLRLELRHDARPRRTLAALRAGAGALTAGRRGALRPGRAGPPQRLGRGARRAARRSRGPARDAARRRPQRAGLARHRSPGRRARPPGSGRGAHADRAGAPGPHRAAPGVDAGRHGGRPVG